MQPDVIVVGAGIIGCAVARALASEGARVTVLESSHVAAGATHASAGVLAPYIEAPAPGPLLELTTRSLAMYDAFMTSLAAEGIAVEYRRCGTLEFASDAATAQRLRQACQLFPGQLEWLDRSAARDLEPDVHADIEGALLVATHGYVHVPQFVAGLAASAESRGAAFRHGVSVTGIRASSATLTVECDSLGPLEARQVVLACGSWADRVAVEGCGPQGIRPIRGQLLRVGWDGPPITHVLWGPDCYVVPWSDGTLLVGATVEDVGFDQRTTLAGVRDLMDAVCGLLPRAWRATLLEARAGLRPGSSDGLPVLGPSERVKGLTYAVGHYRNGILLAPLTARVVADWICRGVEDPGFPATRPDRGK